MNNTVSLNHLHIEISSKCALKCPRCPRAEIPDSLINRQLSLDFFERALATVIADVKKITFCGNDGDPIYATDFLPVVRWIKQTNPNCKIVTITNGSYKSAAWWKEFAGLLSSIDEVHWSLDGWDHASNNQYRVNSDWSSIIAGIQAFKSANTAAYTTWAAIAFKFNEHMLHAMQQQAVDLGFDAFQLTMSTKFGSKYNAYPADDPLEPSGKYVPQGHRYERTVRRLSAKPDPDAAFKQHLLDTANALDGSNLRLCAIGTKGAFINSQGEFFPCCWVAARQPHNQHWQELAQSKFNLYNNTLEDVLAQHAEFEAAFAKPSIGYNECREKCSKAIIKPDLINAHYVTEW